MFEPAKVSPGKLPTVLIADDDADDRELTREALEDTSLCGEIRFVSDGADLLDYLLRRGEYSDAALAPAPDLLLLDLNMPKKDGREALREIHSSDALRALRVVVLTTSNSDEDIRMAYALSVSSYITKPTRYRELVDVIGIIARYWLEIVELPSAPRNAGAR